MGLGYPRKSFKGFFYKKGYLGIIIKAIHLFGSLFLWVNVKI